MHEVRDETKWIFLADEPLRTEAVANFLRDERAGAIDLFLGTTRRWTGSDETVELDYEAYESMAVEEMRRITVRASEQWPVIKAAVHHRTGVVPIAESSVLIGVSSPHRADAFQACRFLIDTLKESVPIWKRERYASGETAWVEGSRGGAGEDGA